MVRVSKKVGFDVPKRLTIASCFVRDRWIQGL